MNWNIFFRNTESLYLFLEFFIYRECQKIYTHFKRCYVTCLHLLLSIYIEYYNFNFIVFLSVCMYLKYSKISRISHSVISEKKNFKLFFRSYRIYKYLQALLKNVSIRIKITRKYESYKIIQKFWKILKFI